MIFKRREWNRMRKRIPLCCVSKGVQKGLFVFPLKRTFHRPEKNVFLLSTPRLQWQGKSISLSQHPIRFIRYWNPHVSQLRGSNRRGSPFWARIFQVPTDENVVIHRKEPYSQSTLEKGSQQSVQLLAMTRLRSERRGENIFLPERLRREMSLSSAPNLNSLHVHENETMERETCKIFWTNFTHQKKLEAFFTRQTLKTCTLYRKERHREGTQESVKWGIHSLLLTHHPLASLSPHSSHPSSQAWRRRDWKIFDVSFSPFKKSSPRSA